MELKHRERVVQVKLVYYGPAIGGKTTNLLALHTGAQGPHRGEFISVNSAQDRTILFDLLPLKGVGFHGFELRFQILAVPGQSNYAATRRLVMRGADAVVFVANSAADRLQDNVASLRELSENLVANGLDPGSIPMVFQYNKRDLPEVTPIEELQKALNFRELPYFPAVAVRGEGVLETLGALIETTMVDLTRRYRTLAVGPEQSVQAWTWEMLTRVFERTSLASGPPGPGVGPLPFGPEAAAAAAESANRRLVRVALPSPPPGESGASRAEVGADTSIVESYAEASLTLGSAVEQLRDERDQVQRRLEDLEHTFRAVEMMALGKPVEGSLEVVLERMLRSAGSQRGAIIAPGADHGLRLVAMLGLEADPFMTSPGGAQAASERLVPLREPELLSVAENPDLAAVVGELYPPVRAIAVVPVRSSLGLHGLALLYHGDTDPLPSGSVLSHLRVMGRATATWFYANRARKELEEARRLLSAVASGEVAHQAIPEMEKLVVAASQFLHGAAREAGTAMSGLEQAAKALERAASIARTAAGGVTAEVEGSATRR